LRLDGALASREATALRSTGGEGAVVEISCERVWREISNYLEGETSTELHARMEKHFKGGKHLRQCWKGLAT